MVKCINGHHFPISQCLDLAGQVIVLIKNTFNYDISIDKDTSKTYKKKSNVKMFLYQYLLFLVLCVPSLSRAHTFLTWTRFLG